MKPIGQSDLLDGILNALGAQLSETTPSEASASQAKAVRPLRLLLVEDNVVNCEFGPAAFA